MAQVLINSTVLLVLGVAVAALVVAVVLVPLMLARSRRSRGAAQRGFDVEPRDKP